MSQTFTKYEQTSSVHSEEQIKQCHHSQFKHVYTHTNRFLPTPHKHKIDEPKRRTEQKQIEKKTITNYTLTNKQKLRLDSNIE